MNNSSAMQIPSNSMVVACLGASHTEAKGGGSYDWIGDLQSRPQNASIRFVNLGVGGDLAYNALKRLPQVTQCRPNKVVVLIGTNDVVTTIFQNARRFLGTWKRLPQEPSPKWYEENLRQIVRRLNNETTAHVALCSLAVIGEDPESMDTPQREVNKRIEEYSAIVKRIAHEESVSYIPFYERMHEQIVASPGRAFTEFSFLSMYRDAFRLFVLHKSLDEIGKQNGWRFHSDGIHLNSRSGKILTDLVQEFVAA
jgi:lysophospholipase L1-like esterase